MALGSRYFSGEIYIFGGAGVVDLTGADVEADATTFAVMESKLSSQMHTFCVRYTKTTVQNAQQIISVR